MQKITIILATLMALIFTGCGGSMYHYDVNPTPLKKGQTKYVLNTVNLTLAHGHGRNLQNNTFANEEELKKSFEVFITQALKEKDLFAENGYKLDIDMNYTRTYNYGGNALNKPQFFYVVKVLDTNNKLIASFSIPRSTTKYSYAKDIAVNMQIGFFKWKAEEEPQDIELISKTLVKELYELGD